jgi:nucleotide-binding universal stress UspA family protein
MPIRAIISYDDTPNDQDALMLGRVLADAGAELTLAYVRHSTEAGRERERLEEHEAEALLDRGAQWLEDPDVARRVIVSGSTAEGLNWLTAEESADVIVFGSEYRTPAGHIALQHSTERLLEGSAAAIAIAPADYRENHSPRIRTIGLLATPGDDAASDTARELAEAFEATIVRDELRVDLLVVGSRPEAPEGKVLVSARAERALESASSPVIVVARGVALRFAMPSLAT